MISQLDPMLPVYVPGMGLGYAFAIIDYSQEHNLFFAVAMDDTGEIWVLNNKKVRLQKNISLGRSVEKVQVTEK